MTIIKSMELQLIFDFNSREFYGDARKDVAYRLRRRSRYHALVLFYFFLCIICLRWPLAQFLLRSRTPLKKMSGICRRLKRRLPKRKLGSATDLAVNGEGSFAHHQMVLVQHPSQARIACSASRFAYTRAAVFSNSQNAANFILFFP